jgi:hypothetical protein
MKVYLKIVSGVKKNHWHTEKLAILILFIEGQWSMHLKI